MIGLAFFRLYSATDEWRNKSLRKGAQLVLIVMSIVSTKHNKFVVNKKNWSILTMSVSDKFLLETDCFLVLFFSFLQNKICVILHIVDSRPNKNIKCYVIFFQRRSTSTVPMAGVPLVFFLNIALCPNQVYNDFKRVSPQSCETKIRHFEMEKIRWPKFQWNQSHFKSQY